MAVAVRAPTREQLDAAGPRGIERGQTALGEIELTEERVDSVPTRTEIAVGADAIVAWAAARPRTASG